jgi:hypothetical protein
VPQFFLERRAASRGIDEGVNITSQVKKPNSYRAEQTTAIHVAPVVPPVQTRRKPFLLSQVQGPGAPRDFELDLVRLVVGRSPDADITLEGEGVSRQHIFLKKDGPEYTVTDLESANGFYLNGVKTHSAVLREGDLLQIGNIVLTYHEGS